jgi:predicted MFS family arabinose efflux permease
LVKIHLRGTYQAYINLLYGGGATIGAAFGGFLCETIGWRWTFAAQIPLILTVYAMAYHTIPDNLGPQLANNRPFAELIPELDITGSCLLFISIASLILGLNFGGNIYSWTHPVVISSLTLAFVTAAILLDVEKKAKRPILPLEMITRAPRANLMFSNFFAMIGSNHILFNAPLYFQVVHGDSATVAGLRISLPALCTTVCGLLAGIFLTYTGRMKEPQVVGSFFMLAGGLACSMLSQSTPSWLGTLAIAPPYAGQGFLFPATILGLVATSSQDEQAVVMTTLILFRNLGIVLGVAISSLILQNSLVTYLDRFITGPDKQDVIERLRLSVRAVQELSTEHRLQGRALQLHECESA